MSGNGEESVQGFVEWIQLAQGRDHWQALVNIVMKLCVLAPQSYLVSFYPIAEIMLNSLMKKSNVFIHRNASGLSWRCGMFTCGFVFLEIIFFNTGNYFEVCLNRNVQTRLQIGLRDTFTSTP
jgi:hypothetical protein